MPGLFQTNQQGAPIFGPTTGSTVQETIFFSEPEAAVSQRIAEMGFTTHRSNPFTGIATQVAKAFPTVWEITRNPSSGESLYEGFTAAIQQLPGLLLQAPSALSGTLFSRKTVGQALRNFPMANQLGEATSQNPLAAARAEAAIVEQIVNYLGDLWYTPLWQRVALYDLQQKWDDYVRYVAANPGVAYSFIQYLVDSGFVDRYFG